MIARRIIESDNFKEAYNKIDKSIKIKLDKLLTKIVDSPEIGKPMRYGRKGTREVYVSPFRLSYVYVKESETIFLLDLYHKNKQ